MSATASTCRRCLTPLEHGDLLCAICGEATPADSTASASGESVAVSVLRCDGCAAAVSYDIQVQAPRCAFCGHTTHVESVTDPLEQTSWFVASTVDADAAHAALRRWLGTRGFFCPSDLKDAAQLEHLRPTWWVGWVFDARALVSWTADSDVGAGRSAWAPHAGQVHMVFDDIVVSASRGLSLAESRVLCAELRIDQGSAAPPATDGAVIEQFDVQRSTARAQVTSAIEKLAIERVSSQAVPGSKRRNVHAVALLEGLETRRCAFPAWVMAYRYQGTSYRAVVHGQNADIVHGTSPTSIAKVLLVVVSIVLAIAVIGLILRAV